MNPSYHITVEIGGMPILLHTQDDSFRQLLARRYAGFVDSSAPPRFEFDIELTKPTARALPMTMSEWKCRTARGGCGEAIFAPSGIPMAGRGRIRQSANPYSIDSVLRIVHTLILAREGGFLLHSAGAIRNGRAFLFSGVSGAGKTTISRLAPPDVTLLTDEVSYVRQVDGRLSRLRNSLRGRAGAGGRELLRSHRSSVLPRSKVRKTRLSRWRNPKPSAA